MIFPQLKKILAEMLKDGSIVDDRSTAEFAGPAELSSFYERTLNDAL